MLAVLVEAVGDIETAHEAEDVVATDWMFRSHGCERHSYHTDAESKVWILHGLSS